MHSEALEPNLSVWSVLEQFPSLFEPEEGARLGGSLACQFVVSGEEQLRGYLVIEGDSACFHEGECDAPHAIVACSSATLLALACGELDPRQALLDGRLEASGDFLLLNAVARTLRRPPLEATRALRRAEDIAARSPPVIGIERIACAPAVAALERGRAAFRENRPVVFTGAFAAEDLVRWTPESLRCSFGELNIVDENATPTTLARICDRIEQNIRGEPDWPYTRGAPLPEALKRVVALPPTLVSILGVGTDVPERMQLWMGSASGTLPSTMLHRDATPMVSLHLHGRKRFLLISPDQSDRVYVHRNYSMVQHCWVNPENPDLQRFPAFASCRVLECAMVEGDVLFIPAGWFHCARAFSPVVSVSFVLDGAAA